VDTLTARYAETFGKPDDSALRRWMIERLEVANDSRVARYWQLVAAVNDWPPIEDLDPVFSWLGRALRTRAGQ
jgi:hypothetical protein